MLASAASAVRASGVCIALAAGATAPAAQTVTGYIVCDNFYQVFSGSPGVWFEGGIGGQCPFGFLPAPLAHGSALNGPQAPPPLSFSLPDDHCYLYIAAWSDDSAQQGMLIDLKINGHRVTSLSPLWEVFATNDDRDALVQAPTVSDVINQVLIADSASGPAGTSVGWVRPSVGGCNQGAFPPGNPWPAYAPVSTGLSWIWFNSGLQGAGIPPFWPGFNHREYLIFRHPMLPAPSCPADVNGDGFVNSADLALLLGSWGACP